MSEEISDAVAEEPPATVSTPLNDPPPVEEPVAEVPADDSWKNDPEKVSAAIKKANDEAAGHRVKAKPYTEAFGGYSQQEQDYLLQVVAMASSQDEDVRAKAAEEFTYLASQLGGVAPIVDPATEAVDALKEEQEAPSPAAFGADEAKELIQEAQKEAEHKARVQARVSAIKQEMADAGYEPDTVEYETVMTIGRNNGYDMQAAISKHRASEQAKIDAFVASQQAQGTKFPSVNRQTGTPPPVGTDPEWMGDQAKTSEAVRQWLRSKAGESA